MIRATKLAKADLRFSSLVKEEYPNEERGRWLVL